MLKLITKNPRIGQELKFRKVSYFSYFLNFAIAFMASILITIIYLIITL